MKDDDQANRAEQAVQHMIVNTRANYAETAERFRVKPGAIRSRIEYRFGSLAMAREANGRGTVSRRRVRKCLVCREKVELDRNQYICPACSRSIDSVYEGAV